MIVVADAGPLHYLVLIKVVDVLQPLYRRVLVPQTVAGELQETNTPAAVRAWIEQPPEWFEIRPDPPPRPSVSPIQMCSFLAARNLSPHRKLGLHP